jgi:hypothetical protein
MIEVDGRVLDAFAIVMTGPSQGTGVVADRVVADGRALVDHHDLDAHALLAQLLGLRPDRLDSGRNCRPAVAPAETSSGVFSRPMPITPTRDAVDVEDRRSAWTHSGLPGRLLDDVGAQEGEVARSICRSSRSTP